MGPWSLDELFGGQESQLGPSTYHRVGGGVQGEAAQTLHNCSTSIQIMVRICEMVPGSWTGRPESPE